MRKESIWNRFIVWTRLLTELIFNVDTTTKEERKDRLRWRAKDAVPMQPRHSAIRSLKYWWQYGRKLKSNGST